MLGGRFRKTAGWLMVGVLTNLTVTPVAAQVVDSRNGERERAARGLDVVELYSPDGSVKLRSEGRNAIAGSLAFSPRLGGSAAQRKSADSLKKVLVRLKEKSQKRGVPFHGERLMHVMTAMSTDNDSVYRAELKKTGVRLVRQNVTTAKGQSGVRTTYWAGGKLRITRLYIAPAAPGPEQKSPRTGGPSASEEVSTATTCQWYDEDQDWPDPDTNNFLWEGECASQQEIDDGLTVLAASEADVDASQTSVSSAINASPADYCPEGEVPNEALECEPAPDEMSPAPTLVTAITKHSTSRAFRASASEDPPGTGMAERPKGGPSALDSAPAMPRTCYGDGILFVASVGAWAWKYSKFVKVAFAVAPPPGKAVIAAAAGVLGAAVIVVGSGIALLECMDEM